MGGSSALAISAGELDATAECLCRTIATLAGGPAPGSMHPPRAQGPATIRARIVLK